MNHIEWRLEHLSAEDLGPDAKTPIASIARKAISKAYRKVVKIAKKLHDDSPDDNIHELRLACKKLRYTLDFFGHLLNAELAPKIRKRMRKLQNALGTFNDRHVQEEVLAGMVNTRLHGHYESLNMAAAIGGWCQSLDAERRACRPRILAILPGIIEGPFAQMIEALTSEDSA